MLAPPLWWDASMPDLAARRDPMPGVERLQTSYTRYKTTETAAITSWELSSSRKNYEQLVQSEHGHFLPEDHMLLTGGAPESIHLRIVDAPAEFGVPVKQDRRFMPAFRVRVEVKHGQRLSLPLTMRAYVINQQEKDNILAWSKEESDLEKNQKKPVTDLKGTTRITHHFEANKEGATGSNPVPRDARLSNDVVASMFPNQSMSSTGSSSLDLPQLQNQAFQNLAKSVPPEMLLNMWNNENDMKLMEQMFLQQKLPNGNLFSPQPELNGTTMDLDGAIRTQATQLNPQLQQFKSPTPLSFQFGSQSAFTALQTQQNQPQPNIFQPAQQFQLLQQAQKRSQLLQGAGSGITESLFKDFEFANLEFIKPTRMNKVYMVFACTLMDLDTLYVVYNVPTVGICRAEQREKACQKLGVPMFLTPDFPMAGNMKQEPVSHQKNQHAYQQNPFGHDNNQANRNQTSASARKRYGTAHESSESDGNSQHIRQADYHALMPRHPSSTSPVPGPGPVRCGMRAEDLPPPMPCSKLALQEFINEEYEETGLLRKLTAMDMQALLSQAGFPADFSSNHASISQAQWDEFFAQYRTILGLLRHIAAVWNLEEPFVVCGFDIDRLGTVHALSKEPAGTFVCRFSMSQPGCLVLSCKTVANHPKADLDDLIHAIIKLEDLNERRVDTWIRDFAGATHVLDVYRSKRVDKRKVFASNYLRLKGMDQQPAENNPSENNSGNNEG
eukprot:gene11688-34411_t